MVQKHKLGTKECGRRGRGDAQEAGTIQKHDASVVCLASIGSRWAQCKRNLLSPPPTLLEEVPMQIYRFRSVFLVKFLLISDLSALNMKEQLVHLPSKLSQPLFFPGCDWQSNKRRFPILTQIELVCARLTLQPDTMTDCHHINSLCGAFIRGALRERARENRLACVCLCARQSCRLHVAPLDHSNTQPHEQKEGNLHSVTMLIQTIFSFITTKRIIRFRFCLPSYFTSLRHQG